MLGPAGGRSSNSIVYLPICTCSVQEELVNIIKNHDHTKAPLMAFYAPHVAHCPLQVPKQYYDKFGFM